MIDRRNLFRFGALAGAAAAAAILPKEAEAATDFLYEGAGSYGISVATWLSTELNSLSSSSGNTLSVLGAAFQNTVARNFADVEFVAGGTFSPTAAGFLELWLLRSLDGGSNYEDGSATVAPGRAPDVVLPVRAGTTITPRSGAPGLILPVAYYKPILRNQTGVALPASGNIIRFAAYSEQY
jgi:hypothetical protein